MFTQLLALIARLRFHEAAEQGNLKCERGRESLGSTQPLKKCTSVWSGMLLSQNPAFLPIKLEQYKYLKNLVSSVCFIKRDSVSIDLNIGTGHKGNT